MSPANTLAKASTLLAVLLVLGLANNVNSKLNGDHALNDGMCNLLLKTTQDLEDARGKYISTKSQIVDDNNNPSARRMMLEANATTKTNAQKIASRVSLLSSDAFAISYTGFKTARAAMLLLSGYLKASVTGTITIDNLALLDFAANVAQLNAELSDLLSRISKLNADAVTPLGLVKG